MTEAEGAEVRAYYAGRRYDIGRDQMVSDSPAPACIAEQEAANEVFWARRRAQLDAMYADRRQGINTAWPSLEL